MAGDHDLENSDGSRYERTRKETTTAPRHVQDCLASRKSSTQHDLRNSNCQVPINSSTHESSSVQFGENVSPRVRLLPLDVLINGQLYDPGRKERLRLLLEEPSSSRLAFWISVVIALTIISSSITAIVATVPMYYRNQEQFWVTFEAFIVGLFTFEFVIRGYAHTSTLRQFLRFGRSFYTLIDLIAIIPFYLSVAIFSDGWSDMQRFTVLRLFRLLRLSRCYMFSLLLQLSIDALIMALKKSTDALVALLVFITFTMVAFSTLMYFAERGAWDPMKREFIDINGNVSQFSSIPASLWFVAEIITTVGLGDIHPKTTLGKTIAIPLMMFSLLIIALPSIVIGRNFAESWAWLRSTRSMRIPPTITSTHVSPTSTSQTSPPLGRETHFLAELSSTQLATQLPVKVPGATDHIPLPPCADVGDHGDVILGILQELQRQNELLERLMVSAHTNAKHDSSLPLSHIGSFGSASESHQEV